MKTFEMEPLEVCFGPTRFDRQSRIWDRLTAFAGNRGAYRHLFDTLRRGGMLPDGPHRVLAAGPDAALSRAYRQSVGANASIDARDGAGPFDVVLSARSIEHAPDPRAAIHEMARVLRPAGLLLLVTRRRVDARDVLRWMWECDVAPLGRLRFGKSHHLAHWLSEAALGRRSARA